MNDIDISPEPGTYIVVLHSRARGTIQIGARGPLELERGWYLYVGSALGPGGLRSRLGRHLSGTGHPRWHIDYVRRATDPCAAWLCVGSRRAEHHWANALAHTPGLVPVVPGLGASDCKCATHLFYTRALPNITDFNCSLRHLGFTTSARPVANAGALNDNAKEKPIK